MSISSISWLFKWASVTPSFKHVGSRAQLSPCMKSDLPETYLQGMRINIKAYLNLFVKVPVSVVVKNRSGALVSDQHGNDACHSR